MNKKIFLYLYNKGSSNELSIKIIKFICFFFPKSIMILYFMVGLSLLKEKNNIFIYLFIPLILLIFVNLVRNKFNIPRPFDELNIEPIISHKSGKSFPSKHTASGFVTSMAILYISPILGILCLILSFIIGFVRILAGVHYPADILAGALLGIIFGLYFFII